ncbi:MAG: MBL fold metallo-hydrolase [Candidatus Nomurabacteria bacterium]|nr:MAG: MBL fold metallo-hydrolase [Candidatus Nomurabacteria bacterium]
MKITKFGHACFVVENDNKSLIVDPGEYSSDLVIPDNVIGIVITHEHADHMTAAHLQQIFDKNPETIVMAHPDVAAKLTEFKTKIVNAGDKLTMDNFTLEFVGGKHAIIAESWPTFANLGVMINERLYYPGDSFTVPNKPVEILALPVAAPWLKISETFEFLQTVKPQRAFPTHDAILSDIGKAMVDRMVSMIAKNIDTTYERIDTKPLEA